MVSAAMLPQGFTLGYSRASLQEETRQPSSGTCPVGPLRRGRLHPGYSRASLQEEMRQSSAGMRPLGSLRRGGLHPGYSRASLGEEMRALLSSVGAAKMRGLDSGLNLRYNQGLPSRPDFREDRGAHFHAQAHISTQSPQTREDAWISRADEDQERRSRVEPPSRHWPQACVGERWLPRLATGVECPSHEFRGATGPRGHPPSTPLKYASLRMTGHF